MSAELLTPQVPENERRPTLLDLVAAVTEVAEGEDETVAIVVALLRSGRVRLAGNFRECHVQPGHDGHPDDRVP